MTPTAPLRRAICPHLRITDGGGAMLGADSGGEAASDTLRVLFVDDDPLARRALAATLNEDGGVVLECIWGSRSEILDGLDRHRPEVVLIDLILDRGELDGIDLAVAMRDRRPESIPIILTSSSSADSALRAWVAGINGYLTKHWLARNVAAFATVIRQVSNGVVIYQVDPRAVTMGAVAGMALTEREVEVVRAKASGRSRREIADLLGIGVRTIDAHLNNARAKLGADSIPDTVRIAKERGLLALSGADD